MKYVIYGAGVILALALFLPAANSTKLRNLPLLIALVLLIVAFAIYRILKYAFLMHKAKKALKQKGFRREKVTFFPFASMLHGHYSMILKQGDKKVKIVFLVTKRKYPHYYFNSVNLLEFYSTNRVIFNNVKAKGATVSDLVETKKVGKQKRMWKATDLTQNDTNILLFNKFPPRISDATRQQNLGNGDKICDTNVQVFDFHGFLEYVNTL